MDFKKEILSIVLLFFAVAMFFVPKKIPIIDNNTEKFLNSTLEKTLISYASVRGLNAVVSIIKHSSLDAEPAGVGFSIGVGEITDPLDDLTERVSDMFFLAFVFLGFVKVLYHLSMPVFNVLISFIFVLLVFYINFDKYKKFLVSIIKILIIIAGIRLLFPLIAFGGNYMNSYFQKEINKTTSQLNVCSFKVSNIFETPQHQSFFDSLRGHINTFKEKTTEIKSCFIKLWNNKEEIINNLITLAYLYFSLFVINIILIPFLFYWILKRILDLINPDFKN